ncbi:hypothetical protein CALCODRAFT_176282 [Calocera cornea HHB12733]|uniref:Uncharacterized protein n=1 Tax=Calocera cornea HHB12733 TaxID=1353952 RepID=A0A165HV45_9BASI|nr:hypothetical protein CALCODRAFT_176282 [Calocera cornea HHB12733]
MCLYQAERREDDKMLKEMSERVITRAWWSGGECGDKVSVGVPPRLRHAAGAWAPPRSEARARNPPRTAGSAAHAQQPHNHPACFSPAVRLCALQPRRPMCAIPCRCARRAAFSGGAASHLPAPVSQGQCNAPASPPGFDQHRSACRVRQFVATAAVGTAPAHDRSPPSLVGHGLAKRCSISRRISACPE